MNKSQPPVHERLWGHGTPGVPAVDIAFVFDTTGSMNDKIHPLVSTLQAFVRWLGEAGLEFRTTIVPFGDLTVPGDRVDVDGEWVYTVRAAKHLLGQMPRFYGGANVGESSIEAMLAACSKRFRPNAVHVVVLLTDDVALTHNYRPDDVHRALTAIDAACFTIAPDTSYYRAWANEHAGAWQPISGSSDVRGLQRMLREVADVAGAIQTTAGGSVDAFIGRAGRRRG